MKTIAKDTRNAAQSWIEDGDVTIMEIEESLPPLKVDVYDVSEISVKELKQVWYETAIDERIAMRPFQTEECEPPSFDIPDTIQIEEIDTEKEKESRMWLEI